MPIEFRCNACNKLLRVPESYAGKKAKCPGCQIVLQIPAASPPTLTPAPPTQQPPQPPTPTPPPLPKSVTPPDFSPGLPPPLPGDGSSSPLAIAGQAPPLPSVSDNPYALPSAAGFRPAPKGKGARRPIVPTRIDFSLLKRMGSVFSKQLTSFLLLGLILVGIGGVFVGALSGISFALGRLADGTDAKNLLSASVPLLVTLGVVYAIFLLVSCWIGLGAIKFCLRIVRGEPHKISDVFSAGRYTLRGLGLGFLMMVVTYGPLWLGLALSILLESMVPALLGLFLYSILILPISLIFMPAFCLIVDRNLGVFGSLGASRKIMRGNLLISFLLWTVISAVGGAAAFMTLGLGYIAVLSFFMLAFVMMYLAASGQLDQSQSDPNTPIA